MRTPQKPLPHPKTLDPEALLCEREKKWREYRFLMVFTFIFVGLMFIEILVTVLLTDARDIPEFTARDFVIFYIFIAVESITLITTFADAILCRLAYNASMRAGELLALRQCYDARFSLLPKGKVRVFSAFGAGYLIRGVVHEENGGYAYMLQHYLAIDPRYASFTTYDRADGFATMEEATRALLRNCSLPLEEEF
ncbi:MAG: hypothetical protein IJW46_01465, partial [Clostridia bacterium]|nr:hypothetical protein [Clostridia bacterium]